MKTLFLTLSSSLLLQTTLNTPNFYATDDDTLTSSNQVALNEIKIINDDQIEEINSDDNNFFKAMEVAYTSNEIINIKVPYDNNYEISLNNLLLYKLKEDTSNNQLIFEIVEENITVVDFTVINKITQIEYNLKISVHDNIENKEVILRSSFKEEPIKEEPIKEEPIKEEPIKEEPIKEEPIEETNEEEINVNEDKQDIVAPIKAQFFSKQYSLSNGFYTVLSGDTFTEIAKNLNLSILQLQTYNPQVKNINNITVGSKLAATRQAVESRLNESEKKYLYKGNGNSYFENPEHFFDYLFPYARELSNSPGEERLYVSIMLAQAALESGYGKSVLSSPPYNNLTGIKRKGNEDYVKMWTREETPSGESYYVLADFKVFPTFYEALKGNADLIRYRGYYDNVWVKNSPTYLDAVKALNKSPYATDNKYGEKILRIINDFNLNKFDFDTILSIRNTNYTGQVRYENSGIYTLPKFVSDSVLYTSYKFNGENVRVVQEAVTESGLFSKIVRVNEGSVIGWIKKEDLNIHDTILSKTSTNYSGQVKPNNEGIYTAPKGMLNSVLYTSYKYNWENVSVIEEATTENGIFSKIVDMNKGHTIGWIKKTDLSTYSDILSRKKVEYYGQVRANNSGIYTKPKGMLNSILYTSYKYNWKNVKIVEEVQTNDGVFSRIVIDTNKHTIGWIKKSDLALFSEKNSNYYAQVRAGNAGIYTAPNPIEGKVLYTSYKYNWENVRIGKEVEINGEIYSKINRADNNISVGWIKKNDLIEYTTIQTSSSKNYTAQVKSLNTGIYTLPKGSYGAILYTSYKFNLRTVRIVEEVITNNGIFSKIVRIEDGSFIGWINKIDLNI